MARTRMNRARKPSREIEGWIHLVDEGDREIARLKKKIRAQQKTIREFCRLVTTPTPLDDSIDGEYNEWLHRKIQRDQGSSSLAVVADSFCWLWRIPYGWYLKWRNR